ncbi:dihydrodipicolinate synthase family protein [Edaphobacter acidisoli]|uniref:Dihydrodipicolinate synthase family protein n=1 Tax=Edaphobacter acidisoli TaxID=2040573 RepID=A0A916W180_9BACT|nr:dihydrodipicolinate synthase family protein [Edaphobacter acidisoli]GGA58015.1 dihydrodipicolinate synthase family protein [Edaphobacter acidisoli]
MLLEGLLLPLTTPFFADGRLNLNKLEQNIERYSKTPAAGLIALARTGEPSMLSDEEARLVLTSAAGAAAREKVLVAGVSRDSVRGTLDMAEHAGKAGFDAVLVKRPGVLRDARLDREALGYFLMVADRSALPVVLGSDADAPLPVEMVAELAGHSRILGIVDADAGDERAEVIAAKTGAVKREVAVTHVFAAVTGRMQLQGEGMVSAAALTGGPVTAVAPAIRTRTKVVGFQRLAGGTGSMLDGLRGGVVGAAVPFAACAPQACYEVLAAWKDGDEALAAEKQHRLLDIARRIEGDLGVAGIKYGCDLNGFYGGPARSPIMPLSGSERAEVEALMHGIRN